MSTPPIHEYLEIAAFALGGALYWHAPPARHQPPDAWVRWGILAGAALGAALGSRALYMLQYWNALAAQPWTVWLGGKSLVGGLLGAVAGVEIAKRLQRWQASTGDGFVLPLLVAIAIGRLGCQFSGVQDLTYGNPTTLPWGWDYGDGQPRHPTALYEILGLLPLAWLVYRPVFARRPGDRFRATMVGYLLLRFGLEFLKPPFAAAAAGTLQPGRYGLFSAIQWACLAGLAYYARDIRRWMTRD